MKNIDDAVTLAQKMVAIGEGAGRNTVAYITNMDVPLGIATGNNIEVIEAIETLKGNGPEDFKEICMNFSAAMLSLANFTVFYFPSCSKHDCCFSTLFCVHLYYIHI